MCSGSNIADQWRLADEPTVSTNGTLRSGAVTMPVDDARYPLRTFGRFPILGELARQLEDRMAVLLEALVQAIAGRKTAARSGRVTRAAATLTPFVILGVVYLMIR